ncbi:hypothetical protein MARA_02910 (plasmid) [Mycolicibacterium arabiense]|uniref:Uncharacterized protein n=1 Tax=Mycolicibacterium arabiense TaxID=1286181 RepID=A0A7I7RRN3_9MYCO|nr:hypothetical protein MARA_02910 [Mycolicibacterium arabiense]
MIEYMPLVKCSHCTHPMRSNESHGRYKANDPSLPKRCRDCNTCTAKYGPLPLIDE